MKNFQLLDSGIDVQPLLDAIERRPEMWKDITIRQEFEGTCHADTETIFLVGPDEFTVESYMGTTSAIPYHACVELSEELDPILNHFFGNVIQATEIGRILIVKLKAGGKVLEHIDEGTYADYYSRFHICLSGDEGSTLTAGDETQHFAKGEAWWFNHKALHSAENVSDKPRIHMILDAVSPFFEVGRTND